MVYRGFCDKQNKDYSVSFRQISISSLEDMKPTFENGRLECDYAGFTGCCNNPKQCSILKNINL